MDKPRRTLPVFLKCIGALVLVIGVSTASAAGVTYKVNRVVGAGVITGTIETNGATGVLTSADIIDWNLKVDADGNGTSGQLLGPLSGNSSAITFLIGSPLTATPTGMFFDFSLSGILQIITPDSAVSWQLQAGAPFSDELIRESLNPLVQAYATHQPTQEQIASAVAPAFPLGLTILQIRIRDDNNDRLRLKASYTLDSCSDGIDPTTEPVTLKLSTPAGAFYPKAGTEFPIQPGEFELRNVDGVSSWRLTKAARQRTGIERFDIFEDGSILFIDRRTSLPSQAYNHVTVELTIGNKLGTAASTLIEQPCDSGRWRVGR